MGASIERSASLRTTLAIVVASWTCLVACGGLDDLPGGVEAKAEAVGVFDTFAYPAISTRGPGTLDVFMLAGGQVLQRSLDNPGGWRPWTTVPFVETPRRFSGELAAVSWSPSRIDLFAVDDFGQLRHLWSVGGIWAKTWEKVDIGFGLGVGGSVSVISAGVDNLTVFALAHNGSNFHGTFKQINYRKGWKPSTYPLGPSFPPASSTMVYRSVRAVTWGGTRIDAILNREVVAGGIQVGPAQIFSNDNGANWSGPWDLGNNTDPTFQTNIRGYGLSTWGTNVLDVVSGSNSRIAQRSFRPDTGWSDWSVNPVTIAPMGTPFYSQSSVSWGPGRIDLVGAAIDNGGSETVWHAWFNTAAPAGWFGQETL